MEKTVLTIAISEEIKKYQSDEEIQNIITKRREENEALKHLLEAIELNSELFVKSTK